MSSERCAWCGRPGTTRQATAYAGDRVRYLDPVLCDVCVHLWHAPGAVYDAWYDCGVDYDSVMDTVAEALTQWYRHRTDGGPPTP